MALQDEFDKLAGQLKGSKADVKSFSDQFKAAGTNAAEAAAVIKNMEFTIKGIRAEAKGLNMEFTGLKGALQESLAELTKTESVLKRGTTAYRNLTSIVTSLAQEEEGIYNYSVKQLENYKKKAQASLSELKSSAEILMSRKKHLFVDQQGKDLNDKEFRLRLRELQAAGRLSAEKASMILASRESFRLEQEAVALVEERLKKEKALVTTFGLTGMALSAASNIAGKFGMDHVREQLDEINDKLKNEMRAEIVKNGNEALGFGRKFSYATKAIGQTAMTLAKGMLDPLFIMQKVYTAFLDVNVAAVEYGRLTGQNGVNTAAMNSSLASSVDVLKVMAEVTKEIGLDSASVFSEGDLGRLAEAKNLLGLSDKQASNLGTRSKVAGIGIRDYEKGIVGATNKYNTLNRSTIGHGAVLQEVLNTTDSISLSLAGDPAKITAAASAALALGLNLQRVDDIAASLTEFQSSISNELEAELLTGKQLNLEKAREYALSNDLAGLAKELSANGASAAEFSSMNRIQQESLAKALGMSRDELAKSIQLEALRKGLGKDAVEAAGDMTLAQVEQLDIQTRLKISLDKLAQAFSPILQAIIPIAEALASVILPIASVIGHISSGLSVLIKPLLFVYGIYKGIQAVMVASLAIGRANYALKALQMGQEAFITREKGTQGLMDKQSLASRVLYNTVLLYQLIKEEGIAGIKTFANTLDDKSIAKKIIIGAYNLAEEAYMLVKSGFSIADVGANAAVAISKGVSATATAGQLLAMPALITAQGALATETALTAGAAVVAAEAMTVGVGTVAIVAGIAAVLAAAGTYMMMKDGVIDPKKGPVVSGEFGSVQLHPNDQIVAGTDLMGKKSGQSISTAAAGNDTHNEIKQMREENKSLLTALLNKTGNVYMDSNKVGKAQVLGSYKSA